MFFHVQQAFRALILLLFSVFIIKLHYTGDINKFVNPKYELLSQIAAFLFLFLFLIQLQRIWTRQKHRHDESCHHHDHSCQHDHGYSAPSIRLVISYIIIIFPLLTGFILPAKTLDASIAAKKGTMLMLSNQADNSKNLNPELSQESNIEGTSDENSDNTISDGSETTDLAIGEDIPVIPPDDSVMSKEEFELLMSEFKQMKTINMEDIAFSTYYEEISKDIANYEGKKIKLTGFVYKEEGFQSNQLVISRFLVTHCIADASIIGFLSEFEEASTLNEDSWIEAEGVIERTTYHGTDLPMIKISSWEIVDEPKEPYLYPITVKIL